MTDNVSDELSGSVMFTDNYQQRYGDAHPQFFTGTLADAIAEATQKPAKDVSSSVDKHGNQNTHPSLTYSASCLPCTCTTTAAC